MKRKDLEQKIDQWLDESTEITGKTILDFVEDKGMLPPEIKNPELPKQMCEFQHAAEKILELKYNKTIKLSQHFYVNEWEPENE